MRPFLSRYKILPPLLGFTSGILISEYIGHEWILIALFSPIFGAIYILKPKLGFLIFIPIGLLFSTKPNIQENSILNFTGKELDVEGVLYRSPDARVEGTRLSIEVNKIFIEGKEAEAKGKTVITTEARLPPLAQGDRIRVIDTKLRRLRSFQNPGSFDIRRYYEKQGIYATGFVPGKEWIISFGKSGSSNQFIHGLDRLRVTFGSFVRRKAPYPESEMLNAITIGD